MWLSRNATNPGYPGEQGESMKSQLNRKLLWPVAFVAIASSLMACSSSTKSDTAAQTTDAATAAAETSAAVAAPCSPRARGPGVGSGIIRRYQDARRAGAPSLRRLPAR